MITQIFPDTAGVKLDPGDSAWETLCDSTRKNLMRRANTEDVLKQLEDTPIWLWHYKHQDASNTHIGPTAQDFHAQFGFGDDETTISTIDPDGVALAAIQELSKRVRDLEGENATMKADLARLTQVVETLAAQNNGSIRKASYQPGLIGGNSVVEGN